MDKSYAITPLKSIISKDDEKKIIEMAFDPKYTFKRIREALGLSHSALYQHFDRSPAFAQEFSRARNESIEELADQLLDIYDVEPDTNKARGKSDNIKWLISKRKPSTYGDKIELNVTQTVDIAAALTEARARAGIAAHNQAVEAEFTNKSSDSLDTATDDESVDDIFG